MTLSNGGMLGSHVYVAMQEGANLQNGSIEGAPDPDINLYVLRGDIGLNWPIARNVDGELSVGVSSISYGPRTIDPEISYFVKGRAFSTLEIINGELVPIFNYSVLKAPGREYTKLHFGLGVNVSLDRGFFWLGAQGLFDEDSQTGTIQNADGTTSYNHLSNSKTTQTHPGRPGLLRHRAQCLVGLAGSARGRPKGNHLSGSVQHRSRRDLQLHLHQSDQ